MPQPHLSVERLTARDRGRAILADVSFALSRGETLALLGPSGSGKTALLHLLAGFLRPQQGAFRLDGRDVTALPPERRGVALAFAGGALFPHMPVLDNVGFALKLRGVPVAARQRQAAEMLERLELSHLAARRPARLDGGEQRLVGLARAAAAGAGLLLVDEPSETDDPTRRERFRRALGTVVAAPTVTALFATHDRAAAFALADQAALLRDGRLEQLGPPRHMYERPATAFAARFTGACNLLPAVLLHAPDSRAVVSVGGATANAVCAAGSVPGPATLCIRPHRMRLDAEGPIRGAVIALAYEGALTRVTVRGPAGDCVADLDRTAEGIAPGAELRLGWSETDAWLIPERAA